MGETSSDPLVAHPTALQARLFLFAVEPGMMET